MTYCEHNVNRCSTCLEIQLLLQTFNKNASISVSQNPFYFEVARSPKLSLNVFTDPTIHVSESFYSTLRSLMTYSSTLSKEEANYKRKHSPMYSLYLWTNNQKFREHDYRFSMARDG